ncbi:MAG: type IX secretion system membrane protein PorP/SprF [Bacteroidota bacterium]
MKTNTIFLFLAAFFWAGFVTAQQDPNYLFYRHNMNFVNPAYAGAGETTDFGINLRSQWSGVDGAPETQSFLFGTYLGGNVGLGATVINDRTFIESQTSVAIDFSYAVQFSNFSHMYFGLKASGNSYNANTSGLATFGIVQDPSLMNIDGGITPNFGAGIYYRTRQLSLAFSIPRLFRPKRLEEGDGLARLGRNRMHMYFMAAYDLDIGKEWILKPSTLLRHVEESPLSMDLTLALEYHGIIELGANYRLDEGLAGFVLLDFNGNLKIGYGYEGALESSLANTNSGTHEVFIRFKL